MKPKNNLLVNVNMYKLILLIPLQLRAIPFIILSYILLSIIELKIRNKNNTQSK
jgi:ABC-type methionine transport system permease subunit